MTDLCKIMTKYGSDKGSGHHNYTPYYSNLFNHLVDKNNVNIFELGIGTKSLKYKSSMGPNGTPGASLRGWREWFKTASIYGADIDPTIMINEDNIKTYVVDQTIPQSINELWNNMKDITFDIIIDDGLHEWYANHIFLVNSNFKLKKGGIYIVEDIDNNYLNDFYKNMNIYKTIFSSVEIIKIPNEHNTHDNTLLVCIM